MRQIKGHYGGSTWAGATPPCRATVSADAALVTPAHALPEAKASTGTGQSMYRDWPQARPEGGLL